jgi:hypothetical protein
MNGNGQKTSHVIYIKGQSHPVATESGQNKQDQGGVGGAALVSGAKRSHVRVTHPCVQFFKNFAALNAMTAGQVLFLNTYSSSFWILYWGA